MERRASLLLATAGHREWELQNLHGCRGGGLARLTLKGENTLARLLGIWKDRAVS